MNFLSSYLSGPSFFLLAYRFLSPFLSFTQNSLPRLHIDHSAILPSSGHIRVGTTLITDPAYLVTRNMEDFITWTHTSAIRKHVMQYNELRDDFDTL